eukprot:gnl/MRDRNA2_/MRDRNA2_21635_c0_seq1.p1 gnl/MRDRNA2_/MRDRNA2_21635_c0~~gnl/MRDRNA2_/MRDRNA2_21635_c0_seq1.p1  ORF type:complete len:207 (+),score=27.29 gnl/MRDRNA2_/MRDRNA2_21635_c0_seq1:66-686(+)
MLFCSDANAHAPVVSVLTHATDMLLRSLGNMWDNGVTINGNAGAEVQRRLKGIDFRVDTMVACLPGRTKARCMRHCDNGRNAVLTMILYLNHNWQCSDGGSFRLFHPGMRSNNVKCEWLPCANRLAVFWADEDCPHEVLPTHRDRFAMTVWYVDGFNVLESEASVDKGLLRLQSLGAVAPISHNEAVERAVGRWYKSSADESRWAK